MDRTVLIIEDDPAIRSLFIAILAGHGFQVLEAELAVDGIALAKSRKPDLVLMDIQLPGMDGLTAASAILSQPGLEGMPIIAVTGHVTAEHRRRAKEAGCVDFLGKPVTSRQLIEAVLRALDGGGGVLDGQS